MSSKLPAKRLCFLRDGFSGGSRLLGVGLCVYHTVVVFFLICMDNDQYPEIMILTCGRHSQHSCQDRSTRGTTGPQLGQHCYGGLRKSGIRHGGDCCGHRLMMSAPSAPFVFAGWQSKNHTRPCQCAQACISCNYTHVQPILMTADL